MSLTSKMHEQLRRYVAELVRLTPPRDGKIRVNLTDHVAVIENGELSVGPVGSTKIPQPIKSRLSAAQNDPEDTLHSFTRRLGNIGDLRICRWLVVVGLERVDEQDEVSATLLYWNGRGGTDVRLT